MNHPAQRKDGGRNKNERQVFETDGLRQRGNAAAKKPVQEWRSPVHAAQEEQADDHKKQNLRAMMVNPTGSQMAYRNTAQCDDQ